MPRRKKDPQLLHEQCTRVTVLLGLADESDAQISRHLGHANPSTLNRLREGESFLDSESLAKLGRYSVRALAHPNLHWVLTGIGEPLLPAAAASKKELDALCTLAKSEAQKASRHSTTSAKQAAPAARR